ncbi:MAG: ATP-binding cassette domain-containing protein, partial [Anaerolineae bacterium]|nr:ATP-binding cassette domain-containing protein [Anaerolineae bacterium]
MSDHATPDALLQVNHLSRSFGGLRAVDDVSFALYEGEILSIIGPNGAGKTTVFNVMTGIYPATTGTIRFQGELIVAASANRWQQLTRSFFTVLGGWIPALPVQVLRGMGLIPFLRPHEIARRGIARTFQTIRLFPNLTALENVM